MKYYYKIYNNNHEVIDVNNQTYRYQNPPGRIIQVDANPELISSSDQQYFYTTTWLPIDHIIPYVSYIESELISEEEYNELREQLDKGIQPIIEEEPVIEEPQESEEPIEEKHEKVFSLLEVQELLSQMTAHINRLETELSELKNKK